MQVIKKFVCTTCGVEYLKEEECRVHEKTHEPCDHIWEYYMNEDNDTIEKQCQECLALESVICDSMDKRLQRLLKEMYEEAAKERE